MTTNLFLYDIINILSAKNLMCPTNSRAIKFLLPQKHTTIQLWQQKTSETSSHVNCTWSWASSNMAREGASNRSSVILTAWLSMFIASGEMGLKYFWNRIEASSSICNTRATTVSRQFQSVILRVCQQLDHKTAKSKYTHRQQTGYYLCGKSK